MRVKAIDLIHHLIDIYGKSTETDLKDNQKRFYEALNAKTNIYNSFERVEYCIQYADDGK